MELKEREACAHCQKVMDRGTKVASVKIYGKIKPMHPKCLIVFEKRIELKMNRYPKRSIYS